MIFNQLPAEINRLVGSYLDYNSRVNFLSVLPSNEDKFVRKLNSEEHNFRIKINLIRDLLNKTFEATTRRKKAISVKNTLRYFAKTKDTIVMDNSTFRSVLLLKAREWSNPMSLEFVNINPRIKKTINNYAKKVIARYENYVPTRTIFPKIKCIEII